MTGPKNRTSVFPVLGLAAEFLAGEPLPEDPLRARKLLAGRVPDDVARAAIELSELRKRAVGKFAEPGAMLLTRKGLEQATRLAVADWRAAELVRLGGPGARAWDRTAGLGADCLALARAGLEVVASELDPLHAACCAANLRAAGVEAPVLGGDSLEQEQHCDLVLLDPDRRPGSGAGEGGRPGGGRRRLDADAFAPPAETWPAALAAGRGGCIKLPPGLDPAALGPALGAFLEATPHRWTWVEAGGDLCEATLWTGDLAPPGEPVRAAVRLDGGTRTLGRGEGPTGFPIPSMDPDRAALLAEPRPSVRRADLAARAVQRSGLALAPFDARVAYLAGPEPDSEPAPDPFLDLFRVLEVVPLDRKQVRRALARHDVGPLTIKKRGVPESAEQLSRKLGGKGARRGLAIVAPTPAGRRFFLVERLSEQDS